MPRAATRTGQSLGVKQRQQLVITNLLIVVIELGSSHRLVAPDDCWGVSSGFAAYFEVDGLGVPYKKRASTRSGSRTGQRDREAGTWRFDELAVEAEDGPISTGVTAIKRSTWPVFTLD
jgi:hypothetical protein